MRRHILYIISLTLFIVVGCKPKAEVPGQFTEVDATVQIYPDYTDIIIPPNIAPLNFIVRDSAATAFVAQLQGGGQEVLAAAAENGKVVIMKNGVLYNVLGQKQ